MIIRKEGLFYKTISTTFIGALIYYVCGLLHDFADEFITFKAGEHITLNSSIGGFILKFIVLYLMGWISKKIVEWNK